MAKKQQQQPRRKAQQQKETNWLLIGALVTIGVLAFGALLALALQDPEPEVKLSLADYCAENPDRCVTKGSDSAPVKIVNVSDYGCGHCATFKNQTEPLINESYVDTGQVQWIYLPYSLGVSTVQSASASMCANEQGLYSEFSAALYAIADTDERLSEEGLVQAAQTAGMDTDAFDSCLATSGYVDTIYQNKGAAEEAGVTGTPTFFINGEAISGNQPFAVFQQRIASALAAGQ